MVQIGALLRDPSNGEGDCQWRAAYHHEAASDSFATPVFQIFSGERLMCIFMFVIIWILLPELWLLSVHHHVQHILDLELVKCPGLVEELHFFSVHYHGLVHIVQI